MVAPHKASLQDELCLQQIESLREEIGYAMQAVSGNRLRSFEDSLWKQEVLCVSLKHLLYSLQEVSLSQEAMARVRQAMHELLLVNETYSRLVIQAQRSNSLLHALCHRHEHAPNPNVASHRVSTCSLEA